MTRQTSRSSWVDVTVSVLQTPHLPRLSLYYNNLELPEPKNHFTVGIVDDVTFTSLPAVEEIPWAVKACSRLSSTDLVLMVLLVPTRTLSRLSATTPTNIARLISLTTQRSREVSLAHLRFGDTHPFHLSGKYT